MYALFHLHRLNNFLTPKDLFSGIFLKFAIDVNSIYGSDMFAAKSAGRELLGLNQLVSTNTPNLNFPLMVLIDYRGFRLIATSCLPLDGTYVFLVSLLCAMTLFLWIDRRTLMYGSADGGHTVQDQDPVLKGMIKDACTKLRLKGHLVGKGKQQKLIYGPGDLEGHLGYAFLPSRLFSICLHHPPPNAYYSHDGRYYVIDCARLCPPFPPVFTILAFPLSHDHDLFESEHHVEALEFTVNTWEEEVRKILFVSATRSVHSTVYEKSFSDGSSLSFLSHILIPGAIFHGSRSDCDGTTLNEYASILVGQSIYGNAVLIYTGGLIGQRVRLSPLPILLT